MSYFTFFVVLVFLLTKSLKHGVCLVLKAHLNPDTKVSSAGLNLDLDFIKFTMGKVDLQVNVARTFQ